MNFRQKSVLQSVSCNKSHGQVLYQYNISFLSHPGLYTAPLFLMLPWDSPGMVPATGCPTTGPSISAIDPAVCTLAKCCQVKLESRT